MSTVTGLGVVAESNASDSADSCHFRKRIFLQNKNGINSDPSNGTLYKESVYVLHTRTFIFSLQCTCYIVCRHMLQIVLGLHS